MEHREIDTRESIRTVTSNTFIVAHGLEKMSLKARKLLYVAISQCRKDDQEFYFYEISAKDFARLMDIEPQAVYKEAHAIGVELMGTSIEAKTDETKKEFELYHLFNTCKYKKGVLRFKIDQQMTDFFLNLRKDFTQPLLADFLKMNSIYSMEIWHLMQREMRSAKPGATDIIQFDLSLEELREVTGTQNKLKQIGQFKERCFDKALREIYDNCGVNITYENIKDGRKVVGFRCTAVSVLHVDTSKIPHEIKKKVQAKKENMKNKA
jgi:plasmid replication initiation protein